MTDHIYTFSQLNKMCYYYDKKNSYKAERGNILGWWVCSLSWIWWWFQGCLHESKLTKSYTWNMCILCQLYLHKDVKKRKRLHVYLFSIYFMYTCIGHLLAPKDSKPYSPTWVTWEKSRVPRSTKHCKYPFVPSLPHHSLAQLPLHWHLVWTYQSCLCPRLGHSSKRKRRRSLSGPHLVDEAFLAPPSALLHSRAQSPPLLLGQRCTRARWEKWEASCGGRNSRRTEVSWGSAQSAYRQRWANSCGFIPLENWYLLLHGGSLPNLCSPKKPRPTSSCYPALRFMVQ